MLAQIRSPVFRVLLVSAVALLLVGCKPISDFMDWHVDDLTSEEVEAEELKALRKIVSDPSFKDKDVNVYFDASRVMLGDYVLIKDRHVVRLNFLYGRPSDLSQLKAFSHLERADIHSDVSSVADLQTPSTLKTLDLSGNDLESLDSGKAFAGIEELDLSKNGLTSVAALNGNESLQNLTLSENDLRTVRLQGLSTLQTLDLSRNQLETIQLQELPTLQDLDLSWNQLETIQLQELPNLQDLDLSRNQLETLRGVDDLPSLKSLDARANEITSIDVSVSGLPNLETVDLSYNHIKDTTALEQVKSVETVDLSDNPLKHPPSNWRETFIIEDTPAESLLVANGQIKSDEERYSDSRSFRESEESSVRSVDRRGGGFHPGK